MNRRKFCQILLGILGVTTVPLPIKKLPEPVLPLRKGVFSGDLINNIYATLPNQTVEFPLHFLAPNK